MFSYLQIRNPRERLLVGLADLAIAPIGWRRERRRSSEAPRRILLLRLERIGDLLMVLDAIALVRDLAPEATIDLAAGSWNADLAHLIPGLDRVDLIDVPWLARDQTGSSWPALLGQARRWRSRSYDLVLNFEPDIRSNLLAWLTGATHRTGYSSGGGGALLTSATAYEPERHVGENAVALVQRALGRQESTGGSPAPRPLRLPEAARAAADAALPPPGVRLIGVHASGGRPSKQWHIDRFAEVARALAERYEATIVLTGSAADRPQIDAVRRELRGVEVVDLGGRLGLPALAAALSRLDLLITSDTGPMHLAAAMGTPLVALFGPSDPRRYGPRGSAHRVLRVDLPCSPCGMVRLPPVRCRNRVPECMDGITADAVLHAAEQLLESRPARPSGRPGDR